MDQERTELLKLALGRDVPDAHRVVVIFPAGLAVRTGGEVVDGADEVAHSLHSHCAPMITVSTVAQR